MRRLSIFYLSLVVGAVCACGGGDGGDDDGTMGPDGPVIPGNFDDPMTQLDSLSAEGAHILETRVHPDGRVFYCTGKDALVMADASDPAALTKTAELRIMSLGPDGGRRCQHLAFSGDIVFMTNRGSDLAPTPFVAAFDIGRAQPREVAAFTNEPEGWSFEGIAAVGDMVYVAIHDKGLAVLQFVPGNGGPGQLLERGSVSTGGNAWAVAASGTTVYVGDGSNGLTIIDASNPDSPQVVGTVAVGGAVQSVELDAASQVVYAAAGSVGLVTIDVSNPASPAVLDTVDTPGSAMQVYLDGDRAYLADWNDTRVFDKTDPANLSLITTETIPGQLAPLTRVLGVAAQGDTVFVGEWDALYSFQLHPDRVAPDIRVTGSAINFGDVDAGEADAIAVILENEGQEPLAVTSVTVDNEAFSVDTPALSLAPGQRKVIEMTFAPQNTNAVEAKLILETDDPDEARTELAVLGNIDGIGVGSTISEIPDVSVALLGGGTWTLTEQLGNPILLAYFATF